MRFKQEVKVLTGKAISSLTVATSAFNSPHDTGRTTQVLLSLQHAFEMLLKAALVHRGVEVFDRKTGRSIGFDKCLKLSAGTAGINLKPSEAGTLRTIDAMRDDEQHWFNEVTEQVLYLYARAGITLFDDLLQRVFKKRLADHLPARVLPLSVDPPQDLDLLIDSEYSQIAELLKPGQRMGHSARARIRTLLALEAHTESESQVSAKDVERVEKGIKAGQTREAVFPKLQNVITHVSGTGVNVTVHIDKREGVPFRYVADETVPAAAVREIDLQRKFTHSPTELASAVNLSPPRATALRQHLGLDSNPKARHVFVYGSSQHPRFSESALQSMLKAIKDLDMDAVWEGHKPLGRSKQTRKCSAPGCAAP